MTEHLSIEDQTTQPEQSGDIFATTQEQHSDGAPVPPSVVPHLTGTELAQSNLTSVEIHQALISNVAKSGYAMGGINPTSQNSDRIKTEREAGR